MAYWRRNPRQMQAATETVAVVAPPACAGEAGEVARAPA